MKTIKFQESNELLDYNIGNVCIMNKDRKLGISNAHYLEPCYYFINAIIAIINDRILKQWITCKYVLQKTCLVMYLSGSIR